MSDESGTPYAMALVAELAKKAALVWIAYDEVTQAVWHVWVEDAICVVSGGEEQPLPGIADQTEVTVILRSKATRHRLAQVSVRVDVLSPESPSWEAVTSALAKARLNLVEPSTAATRWAAGSVVTRLVPTEVIASPGSLPDDDQRERPVDSPALTAGKRPFVLHRRRPTGPRLSGGGPGADPDAG